MSENQEEKRKISLADAMKQKLAQKKQQASNGPQNGFQSNATKTLRTQNNKKPNNQRRRTGGS
ncbi:hypothetical protein Q5741_15665 [Paenibacillus sp. JX-17]|uniref:DUF4023 domain-containing protein n=1 Tax=Paenibacillus lacisoli TaxID=3064525 RepID=A0ABT9CF00_9BACL|nr:hypothetical protein [Paenibacillus sp. JX-17]MDO7907849.1 hypothetical protein [Paenibacillus sp. JX-17]